MIPGMVIINRIRRIISKLDSTRVEPVLEVSPVKEDKERFFRKAIGIEEERMKKSTKKGQNIDRHI